MHFTFTTRRDAHTAVHNSGVADWEWGGNASAEGFADWLWRNRDGIDTGSDEFDAALREYLVSVGENPDDYSL